LASRLVLLGRSGRQQSSTGAYTRSHARTFEAAPGVSYKLINW
jgi:hypothetical protein